MARIRKIEIANFRGIRSLTWQPAPGMNCLIGPGDSGKSTVLDAIVPQPSRYLGDPDNPAHYEAGVLQCRPRVSYRAEADAFR